MKHQRHRQKKGDYQKYQNKSAKIYKKRRIDYKWKKKKELITCTHKDKQTKAINKSEEKNTHKKMILELCRLI